jgi:ribosomal protein S13
LKFEHILQVYWAKGFFWGGKLIYPNNLNYSTVTKDLYGVNHKFKILLTKRLEFSTFLYFTSKTTYLRNYLIFYSKNVTKTINIIFSQINNVNSSLIELKKLNILRKYLVKSYKGYCHVIGKPVRGQRTWSNGWNSFKCNNFLRNFVNTVKTLKLKNTGVTSKNLKKDYTSVKKKYIHTINKGGAKAKNLTQSTTSLKTNLLVHKSWY